MQRKNIRTIATFVAVAGGLGTAYGQGPPVVTVPSGTDVLGESFQAPGAWPGTTVSGAWININLAPGTVLDGAGSDRLLIDGLFSGPVRWTSGWTNEGDFDLNLGPAQPDDPRSYPDGDGGFWDAFRGNPPGSQPGVGTLRLNDGLPTYAWAAHPFLGIFTVTAANNGRDNDNTVFGLPVGTLYAHGAIATDDFRSGRAYSPIDGTHRNGDGSSWIQFNYVGTATEAVLDISATLFPFEQGWLGGYVRTAQAAGTGDTAWISGSGGVYATPGLSPDVVTWESSFAQTSGRIDLPGDATPDNGMLFTIYAGTTNDASLIAVLPDADGWAFAMRRDDVIDSSGGSIRQLDAQSRFGFVYVPYSASNFFGGYVDGSTGDLIAGSGITVTRVEDGVYEISIPGKDKTTGSVSLQIAGETPGAPGVPDITFANFDYDFDRDAFVVNTRFLTFGDDVFGETCELRDASFYFLYSDFETPISLDATCRADIDGDGSLTIFDFLAFQNLFAAGDLGADFDGDGSLTIFDFLAFQNEFAAGCD
ncbi:MAG: hypothetical protein KIT54_04240 [Phycisphaeraceae bacterium]|nr:hypothetical protein [Phycisphaeraceae bacterium]